MDEDFWQSRWRENQIGFHEEHPNELLVSHFDSLQLPVGGRVFVPLCGKSVDLDWLLAKGFRVVGIEFSEKAVEEVFARQNLATKITSVGTLKCFSSENIDVFVGNFFDLSINVLGAVDGVYDRAALVALPPETRKRYVHHLAQVTKQAPQLLVTFDYDQEKSDGPPFSVPKAEIERHYGESYAVESLASRKITGPLSQRCEGSENTWLLKSK